MSTSTPSNSDTVAHAVVGLYTATLDRLPVEVHDAIAQYLRPSDLYQVCQVSLRLRRLYEAKKWHHTRLSVGSARYMSVCERAYRIPLHAAVEPWRYARWLRPELIRVLDIDDLLIELHSGWAPEPQYAVEAFTALRNVQYYGMCTANPSTVYPATVRVAEDSGVLSVFLDEEEEDVIREQYGAFLSKVASPWLEFPSMRITDLSAVRMLQLSFLRSSHILSLFPNLEDLLLECWLMREHELPAGLLAILAGLRLPATVRRFRMRFEKRPFLPPNEPQPVYQNMRELSRAPKIQIPQITSVTLKKARPHADWIFEYLKFPNLQELDVFDMPLMVLACAPTEKLVYLKFNMTVLDGTAASALQFLEMLPRFQGLRKLEADGGLRFALADGLFAGLGTFQDMHRQGTAALAAVAQRRRGEAERRVQTALAASPKTVATDKMREYLTKHTSQVVDTLLRAVVDPAGLLADLSAIEAEAQQEVEVSEGSAPAATTLWRKHVSFLFLSLEKLAVLEYFWEQVQQLPRLDFLAFTARQSYLTYSPRWYSVATSHPSLQQVRVDSDAPTRVLLATYMAVYESRPTVHSGPVTKGAAVDDNVALRQSLVPALYYTGRNVQFGDLDHSWFSFVVDVVRRREFANFVFPLQSDHVSNNQERLQLVDSSFDGWN